MWKVSQTEEFDSWFDTLDDDSKAVIRARVKLLSEFGPQLPRPYEDTLKGSKISNLKELRAQTVLLILRVSYIFDKERKAFLLTGGDKKGKNQDDFYKRFIEQSEQIVKKYGLK